MSFPFIRAKADLANIHPISLIPKATALWQQHCQDPNHSLFLHIADEQIENWAAISFCFTERLNFSILVAFKDKETGSFNDTFSDKIYEL